VPDVRNSKVFDLIAELQAYGVEVFVHDPVADAEEVWREYGVVLTAWDALPRADAIVVAVAHATLVAMATPAYLGKLKAGACLVDAKARLDASALQTAGVRVWRL
jgi:UDP-N-acetyl-D-galactosamine dehydrogenase